VSAAAAKPAAVTQNDAVASALLPPVSQLADQLPKARAVLDERFNVSFNNVPVQQFYNSIVAGTRYNMLINPEVTGNITANLKDVTLFEALDAIRELYGYDYKVEGTRIYIRPLTMQTKMFKINYLVAVRARPACACRRPRWPMRVPAIAATRATARATTITAITTAATITTRTTRTAARNRSAIRPTFPPVRKAISGWS
jgi:type II secretory pathway component GspD/PulD (secretin)